MIPMQQDGKCDKTNPPSHLPVKPRVLGCSQVTMCVTCQPNNPCSAVYLPSTRVSWITCTQRIEYMHLGILPRRLSGAPISTKSVTFHCGVNKQGVSNKLQSSLNTTFTRVILCGENIFVLSKHASSVFGNSKTTNDYDAQTQPQCMRLVSV